MLRDLYLLLVSIEFMLTFQRFFFSKVNLKVFFKILIRGSRICLQGKECTLLPSFSFCPEGQLSNKKIQQFCRAVSSPGRFGREPAENLSR